MHKKTKYKLPSALQLRLIEAQFGIEEDDDNTVRLSRYSPAGQDFGISVDIGENLHDLKRNLAKAYEGYDVSYEAYIWLDNTGHGKDGAPHDMKDVYEDMETCHEYIEEMRQIVSDYLDEHPDDDDDGETAAELLVPPEMH